MPAAVGRTSGRKYQAWCPECSDGVNAGKWFCDEWAKEHNTEKHQESNENDRSEDRGEGASLGRAGSPASG